MSYRHCNVVNSEGYVKAFVLVVNDEIQSYILKPNEKLVDNSIAPLINGFLKPRWDGSEWVEGASREEINATLPTLDELKAAKKAAIAEARWLAETGGIEFCGMAIVTDRESQSMINAAVTSTLLDPTYTVRWKTVNGFVALDAPTIQAVATAVRSHVQVCFDHEAELYEKIEAIKTTDSVEYAEAVKNITWELT